MHLFGILEDHLGIRGEHREAVRKDLPDAQPHKGVLGVEGGKAGKHDFERRYVAVQITDGEGSSSHDGGS